jgi:hypothetical protein
MTIIKDDYLYKHEDGYIVACLSINNIPVYEEYYPTNNGRIYSNNSARLLNRIDLDVSRLTEMGRLVNLGYIEEPTNLILNK